MLRTFFAQLAATEFIAKARFALAEELLSPLLQTSPLCVQLQIMYLETLIGLRRGERASALLNELLRQEPTNPAVHYLKGMRYVNVGAI